MSLSKQSLQFFFNIFFLIIFTCVKSVRCLRCVYVCTYKCVYVYYSSTKTYDGNNGDMTSLFTSCIHRDDLRCRLDHVICFYNNDIRVSP